MRGNLMSKRKEFVSEDIYIRPRAVGELMKAAQSLSRTTYLYGATGWGKTLFVTDFLGQTPYRYYSMSDSAALAAEDGDIRPGIVVADDLQLLCSAEARERAYAVLERLSSNPNVWLILISRAPLPAWLKPLCIRRLFITIGEQDLALSEKEEASYWKKWNLAILPQSAQQLRELCCGYPLALRIAAMRLAELPEAGGNNGERRKAEQEAIERARVDLWDYLQTEIFNGWDAELQEILMELSVVNSFDLTMAQRITQRGDVGRFLLMAQETGNFMTEHNENGHMIYELRRPLRLSMKKRLVERYPQAYINKLYYSAGMEYELRGQFMKALRMYEKCGSEDSISRLLTANAQKHAGSGHYWELRKYYLALSDETIRQSPELMAGMSLLQSILVNDVESERWYNCLSDYMQKQTGGAKKAAQARLLYLDIALPQRGTARMTDVLKQAWIFMTEKQTILPEMSLTNNQPSLMQGGKDFCEWSKRDRELAVSIGKPVELLLGSYGKGLVNIALAESFLEKGADAYEVQSLSHKGWMKANAGGRPEMVFVAVGLLGWLSLLNNRCNDALESLESFRSSAFHEAPQLLNGIDALRIRFLLYTGKGREVEEWMAQAPDENAEFCTLERYRYITKVRVYLAEGRKEKALSLLQRLVLYAEKRQRTYLWIEAELLLAITQYRMGGEEWQETFQTAVTRAEEYHFVRVLSREGVALAPLLRTGDITWKDENFKKQVRRECKRMAEFYPAYLSEKQSDSVLLSDKALTILRLQAEGKSVDQIAALLYLSRSGVKYYIRDTYQKLGVGSKAAAINEARNRKIL